MTTVSSYDLLTVSSTKDLGKSNRYIVVISSSRNQWDWGPPWLPRAFILIIYSSDQKLNHANEKKTRSSKSEKLRDTRNSFEIV